jgi:hypothetical protein
MTNQMSKVIQHLRSAWLLPPGADLTDGQLLERFVSRRETAALEALVRRHGPMGRLPLYRWTHLPSAGSSGRSRIVLAILMGGFLRLLGYVPGANQHTTLLVDHAGFDQVPNLIFRGALRVFADQVHQGSGDFFVGHRVSPRSSWTRMHATSRTAI